MPHLLQHISRKAISAMNKPAFFDPNRLLYASSEGVTKIINADNTISTLVNANVFNMKAPFSVTRGSYFYLTDYIVKKEAILCFKGNTIVLFNNEALRIYDKDMETVRSAFPSSELTEAEGLTVVNNNITCVDFDADTINGQEIGELFQYGWDHEPGWTPDTPTENISFTLSGTSDYYDVTGNGQEIPYTYVLKPNVEWTEIVNIYSTGTLSFLSKPKLILPGAGTGDFVPQSGAAASGVSFVYESVGSEYDNIDILIDYIPGGTPTTVTVTSGGTVTITSDGTAYTIASGTNYSVTPGTQPEPEPVDPDPVDPEPEPQDVWGNPGYDGSGNRTFEIDFHTTATTQDLSAQRSDEADSYGNAAESRGHYGVHINSAYPGNHIITNTDTMVKGNIYLPGVPFDDGMDATQSSNFLPEGTYIRVCNGLNASGGRIMTGFTSGRVTYEELGGSDGYDCYDFIVVADEDMRGGYKYVVVAQSDAIDEDPDTLEPIYPEFPPVQP